MRAELLVLALSFVLVVAHAEAQGVTDGGTDVVLTVELSADTVGIGDVFELRIEFELPPGQIAYVPDSLESTDSFESLGPVRWSVERAAEGASAVSLTYPLIAFRVGVVAIPEFTILTGRTASVDGSGTATGTEAVGSWHAIEIQPELAESLTSLPVPSRRVWVASVLLLEDISRGLVPRPADDVVGSSWHRWALLFGLAFAALLTGVLSLAGRDWFAARYPTQTDAAGLRLDPVEAARLAALAELDRLLALRLHEEGRVDEFYTRSSSAVRGYVEHLDAAWGAAHTSTELMGHLEERANGNTAPALLAEMHVAEVVKFGRLRPDSRAAETHWNALRGWVAGGPDVGSGDVDDRAGSGDFGSGPLDS